MLSEADQDARKRSDEEMQLNSRDECGADADQERRLASEYYAV